MPSEEEMYSCERTRECAGWRKHLHTLKRPTPVTFATGLLRHRFDWPRTCATDINSSLCHRRYRRTAKEEKEFFLRSRSNVFNRLCILTIKLVVLLSILVFAALYSRFFNLVAQGKDPRHTSHARKKNTKLYYSTLGSFGFPGVSHGEAYDNCIMSSHDNGSWQKST